MAIYRNKEDVEDLELELTTLCNASCQLCYRNYKDFNSRYPATVSRELKDVINQLDGYENLRFVRLVGTISEPTLYKNFMELVRYIKERNVRVEICTNGDTNNEAWWKELSALLRSEDYVYFTICGSTQEIHQVYRSGTRLDKILKNARAFRTDRRNDYAQCIRFEYNKEDFKSDEFKNTIKDFSNVYMTETFISKDESNYKNKSMLGQLKPTKDRESQYEKIVRMANAGLTKKSYCKSWENKSQQVDIEGKIYPCYLFLEANGGKEWDQDYEKILNQNYSVCKFCEKTVMNMCMDKNLEHII